MPYPPRLSHLLTRAVLTSRLLATYARAHALGPEEAAERLARTLATRAREVVLDSIWAALLADSKQLSDERLLEKVARTVALHPERQSRAAPDSADLGAALLQLDALSGEAGEAAVRALAQPAGQAAVQRGLSTLGNFLARELTKTR